MEDYKVVDCFDAMRQNEIDFNCGFDPSFTVEGETISPVIEEEIYPIPFMEWDENPYDEE